MLRLFRFSSKSDAILFGFAGLYLAPFAGTDLASGRYFWGGIELVGFVLCGHHALRSFRSFRKNSYRIALKNALDQRIKQLLAGRKVVTLYADDTTLQLEKESAQTTVTRVALEDLGCIVHGEKNRSIPVEIFAVNPEDDVIQVTTVAECTIDDDGEMATIRGGAVSIDGKKFRELAKNRLIFADEDKLLLLLSELSTAREKEHQTS